MTGKSTVKTEKVKYRKSARKKIFAFRGRGENIIIMRSLVFRTDTPSFFFTSLYNFTTWSSPVPVSSQSET